MRSARAARRPTTRTTSCTSTATTTTTTTTTTGTTITTATTTCRRPAGLRGLIAVGVSGGLLPCPTALVVLLAAISLHRIGYGLALIVAFSLGLAAVVSGIALLAITAKRTFGRMSFEGGRRPRAPAVSAAVILVVGLAMTLRAFPGVVGEPDPRSPRISAVRAE